VDISFFDKNDIFLLRPVLVHCHAFGVEVNPHLRTVVSNLKNSIEYDFQDISYKQWEQGKEIYKIAS